jgi:general secretion pathway protein E
MSIEDPVEFRLPGVVQVPVRPDRGVTFASAFRSVLRSDPDVILVGEIRDPESMLLCCQAALTGHLVMTTLHTHGAAEALVRMVDLGIPPFLIAEAVRLVVGQRVARLLCPDCRVSERRPAEDLERAAGIAAEGGLDRKALPRDHHRPVGCDRCVGGYRGRTALVETLEVDREIGAALRRGADLDELRALAVRRGMTTLAAAGLRKAAEGRTTIEEVYRVLDLERS